MSQINRRLRASAMFVLPVVVLGLLLTGCEGSSSSGGITIPESDASAPSLSLGVSQQGGQDVTVSAGDAQQSMTLTTKTGVLNLAATAKDSESGIQAVEIWVNKKTTSCDAAGICSMQGPALLGGPMFESSEPQQQPGSTSVESSILADALDLLAQIPQGSVGVGETREVELIFFAIAVNHLGGRTQTPDVTVVFREP